jgi:hypothetical protein
MISERDVRGGPKRKALKPTPDFPSFQTTVHFIFWKIRAATNVYRIPVLPWKKIRATELKWAFCCLAKKKKKVSLLFVCSIMHRRAAPERSAQLGSLATSFSGGRCGRRSRRRAPVVGRGICVALAHYYHLVVCVWSLALCTRLQFFLRCDEEARRETRRLFHRGRWMDGGGPGALFNFKKKLRFFITSNI